MSSNQGFRQGQTDAQSGKPPAPQGNMTSAERENYLKGYNSGKK